MDFKGITWAGNMYQKFEAMCLEVEEVMYQDTVKYMENQAQKVSVSVKKFYSEVMEDLLRPSCMDPMKVPSADSFLDPYAQTDINKKLMPSIFDNHTELKKKENEDEVISDMIAAAKESPLSGHYDVNSFSSPPPGVLVQDKCSEPCSGKSKKVGVYRRPVGIKRISHNNHSSKDSYEMTPLSGGRSSKLLSCDMRSSYMVASGDVNVISSSDFDMRRDTGEAVKGNAPISDKSPASDKILSAESVRQKSETSKSITSALAESVRLKKGDSECTSSCCGSPTESIRTSMNGIPFSKSCSSNVESENKKVMAFNEGISMNDGSLDVSSNICNGEAWDKEVLVSNDDNFDMEVIENEEFAELRPEIFEPVERTNLEETCVLVEGYKLDCAPQGTGRNSYKKKIRQALLSKLRSTRQQNECVSQHKDLHGKENAEVAIPVLTTHSEKRKFPATDSFESEWELL